MTSHEPNRSPEYTSPLSSPGGLGAQPATGADRWALVALAISLTVALSCVPGLNCLAPLAPLVAGLIALSQAKNAADPQRARTYGWIATVIGALILVVVFVLLVAYGALIYTAINEARSGDF